MKNTLRHCFNTASGKHYCNEMDDLRINFGKYCFNTASGKHYCNNKSRSLVKGIDKWRVSIPQAVSTIAIAGLIKSVFMGLKNRFWKTSHRKRSKRAHI